MEGKWQLNWRNDDGRFWEQFDGVEMTLECGFDGEGQNSWAVGAAGIRSTLELDDREVRRETQILCACFGLKSETCALGGDFFGV